MSSRNEQEKELLGRRPDTELRSTPEKYEVIRKAAKPPQNKLEAGDAFLLTREGPMITNINADGTIKLSPKMLKQFGGPGRVHISIEEECLVINRVIVVDPPSADEKLAELGIPERKAVAVPGTVVRTKKPVRFAGKVWVEKGETGQVLEGVVNVGGKVTVRFGTADGDRDIDVYDGYLELV